MDSFKTVSPVIISCLPKFLNTIFSVVEEEDISKIGSSQATTLNMYCATNWTRVFTQVYSSYDRSWQRGSCVEYVRATSHLSGHYYSASTNRYEPVNQREVGTTKYSSKYDDFNWRKQQAVLGYLHSNINWNTTGAVQYKYGGTTKVTHSENF